MLQKQCVLVELRNTDPYVEILTSKNPITLMKAVRFYRKTVDFNEDQDSITFIDEPTETKL